MDLFKLWESLFTICGVLGVALLLIGAGCLLGWRALRRKEGESQ